MIYLRFSICWLALLFACAIAGAADPDPGTATPAAPSHDTRGSAGDTEWYQFLGPRRNAVHECGALANAWPEGGPRQVWKVPCAVGYAGPIVRDGVLVLLDRQPKSKQAPVEAPLPEEVIHGLDPETGKELWRASFPCARSVAPYNTYGPAATPAAAEGKVVCMFISGTLRCFELKTGKLLWERDLAAEFELTKSKGHKTVYDSCPSPLVVKDLVIQQVCSGGAGLVAFRLEDGKEAWRTAFFPNYGSSPTFHWHGETPVVVAISCSRVKELKGDLFGVHAATGEGWWYASAQKTYYNTPFPIFNEGLLVAEGGSGAGPTFAYTLPEGGKGAATLAWKDAEHNVRFANYLIYRGLVFGQGYFGNPKNDDHKMYCLDAKSGALQWERPHKEKHQWMIGSDGKVIHLHENGELSLFDAAARSEYRELARAKVLDKTWSFPALAGGRLYLRSDTQCVCLNLTEK